MGTEKININVTETVLGSGYRRLEDVPEARAAMLQLGETMKTNLELKKRLLVKLGGNDE